MSSIIELFTKPSVAHSIILLCLAVFPGLWLGNRSLFGIRLGIAGVLFSGLAVGALTVPMENLVLYFIREWGLILFVFAVGLQVGPGFFANFRNQGMALNRYAVAIVLLGFAMANLLHFALGIPLEAMVGILSGAVTNTPGLGAAQQALNNVPHLGGAAASIAGTGYAVAYPFGIFGILLTMILVRRFFRIRVEDEARKKQAEKAQDDLQAFTVRLRNPLLAGKSLSHVLDLLGGKIVISRLGRNGEVRVPRDEELLQLDDQLHVVCHPAALAKVTTLLGTPSDQDLRVATSGIEVRRILVSSTQYLDQNLAHLRFTERRNVRITRIRRNSIDFVPDGNTYLQLGDQITAVGLCNDLQEIAEDLGDSQASLDHPNLLPIFLGIMAGVVLGSIPLNFPGLPAPVKLGLAGGPLLIALLMGFTRRLGPLHFHFPATAAHFMKEFGIILFLAAVGMGSGESFWQALRSGEGWIWMGCGALVTLVPLVIVGFWARWKGGLDYLSLCGLLAGAMTDPPALGYANSLHPGATQSIAYASVYPLTMFLRVLTAQVFVILLV